ncbi:tRNA (cytosine(32)/uridine(32)-2'-O)-methyltransferase TrmJ [Acidihalobacter yilgarnensis]|uniref:tRNA (cytidine/uridine-2'-O-)-methyltransferase TrmJ n=1 Tax=Acidihalobacter yilgarnensis TaxID=2819280 RepID=A0A1D8IP08_9GAMM|nr:RNA methyltransferase [Acidihalobacter yilgarnensis]AOU98228.1 tRNA (cytosine(32)/uridine(32)-2'-O)-methyltransferase TrmJ [Acidihalobacter yilgarnensis]
MIDLEEIRIVLVAPSHPGNIGAAARAMKTMGLSRLYLVSPESYPHAEATARASGADDVLARALVCQDLDEALRGVTLVLGTSARARSLEWPTIPPRQAAERINAESGGEAAIVFGRERSGLTNSELERCHYRVHIPANPEYSSLNLAAAVQLLCYELALAAEAGPVDDPTPAISEEDPREAYAEQIEVERFYVHLEAALAEIEFLDRENPRQLMRRLKRLFNRTRLLRTEVNLLRGILTAAQRQAKLARGG